jgi:putative ABC transport system permease protein
LRAAFHDVDAGLPFRQPSTVDELVLDVLLFERLKNWMFGTFAVLAVLLALIGMYGLISHEIELSTRDIGVRIALGATRLKVFSGVYQRVLIILGIGVTCGLVITVAVRKVVESVVLVHASKDAGVIAALAAGMLLAGILAAAAPARRAAVVEPMQALRYE